MKKTSLKERQVISYFRQAYLNKRTFIYICSTFTNLTIFLKFLWMKKIIYGFSTLYMPKSLLVYLKYNNKNEKKLFSLSSRLGWKGIKSIVSSKQNEIKNIYFFVKLNRKYYCYSSFTKSISGLFIFLI
jgi:hypothetical protein